MNEVLSRLILLNGEVTGFQSPLGLRTRPVHCVDRHGRLIHFVAPDAIRTYLSQVLDNWRVEYDEARTDWELASACAWFWYGFITIHPFLDGNGRTAKAFLIEALADKGIEASSLDLLDRLLLTGDIESEMPKLQAAFLCSFSHRKGELA